MNKKLKSISALKNILRRVRQKDERVVFTNGCFDILHRGHVEYLEKAKALGDVLVVGLNSDVSIQRLKGKGRPINTQSDRAAVLSGLTAVDFIVVFNEGTPFNLIKEVRPDILVKGADWRKGEIVGSDIVASCGGEVKTIKYLNGYSTSKVIKRIAR